MIWGIFVVRSGRFGPQVSHLGDAIPWGQVWSPRSLRGVDQIHDGECITKGAFWGLQQERAGRREVRREGVDSEGSELAMTTKIPTKSTRPPRSSRITLRDQNIR